MMVRISIFFFYPLGRSERNWCSGLVHLTMVVFSTSSMTSDGALASLACTSFQVMPSATNETRESPVVFIMTNLSLGLPLLFSVQFLRGVLLTKENRPTKKTVSHLFIYYLIKAIFGNYLRTLTIILLLFFFLLLIYYLLYHILSPEHTSFWYLCYSSTLITLRLIYKIVILSRIF